MTSGGSFIKDNDDNKKIEGGTDGTLIGNTLDQLHVTDRANDNGVYGAISVGTTATAARVGGSNLVNRKTLTVFNNGSQSVYWGYSNAVTINSGTPIFKNQTVTFDHGPNITVWLIAPSGTQDVRVGELA